ncbi:hypothetical protein FQA39_LY14705 [Lamprigera yunnana]|nr:hypothetical protein FQA39_LY14705 [Lamprigera yunnana]
MMTMRKFLLSTCFLLAAQIGAVLVSIDSAKEFEIPQRESLAGSIVNEKTARVRKINATRQQEQLYNIGVEIAKEAR